MKTHPLRPSRRLLLIYRAAILVAMMAYMLYEPNVQETSIFLVVLLVTLPILVSLFWYYRITVRIKQQALNSALAYTTLADKTYFVYLRSFDTAGRMPILNAYGGWTERSLVGKYWDVEFALTTAVAHEGLLVAIGDKRETVGAAKVIASDDEWQARFVDLCSKAKAIFVLPDVSESLIWEMTQIIGSPTLSTKTFFLMPPRRSGLFRFLFGSGVLGSLLGSMFGHRGRWWTRTRDALGKRGLVVPGFRWEGAIFSMGGSGRFDRVYSFDWLQSDLLTKFLAAPSEGNGKFDKRWFERWPIAWSIFTPGAFLPVSVTFICVLLFRSFFFQPFNIPSGSMKNSLLVGDYLFVSKYSYGYSRFSGLLPSFTGRIFASEPSRGDVVVFRLPKDEATDYIKRVVGLPGDRIQVKQGLLYINEAPVKRERLSDFIGDDPCGSDATARVKRWKETLPNGVSHETLDCVDNGFYDDTNVYAVPPGHYFMMGDNRDNSTDSRVLSAVGYVPFDNIIGRAQMIFFSISEGEHAWMFWRWSSAVRWNRIFHLVR